MAGHFQYGNRRGLALEHGPADHVRCRIRTVAFEFSLDGAVLDGRSRARGKAVQHGRIIGTHKTDQVAVKHHLVIAVVREEGMQIPAQRDDLILLHRTLQRITVLIQHIAFQNQQGLDAAEQFQFPVPFRNQCLHVFTHVCLPPLE